MLVAYKRRIAQKKHGRKMRFEMFHDPIGAFRRKADEKKEMSKLLGTPLLSNEERRRIAEFLLLDRGYDSTEMIKTIKDAGIIPAIGIRNRWKDGEKIR